MVYKDVYFARKVRATFWENVFFGTKMKHLHFSTDKWINQNIYIFKWEPNFLNWWFNWIPLVFSTTMQNSAKTQSEVKTNAEDSGNFDKQITVCSLIFFSSNMFVFQYTSWQLRKLYANTKLRPTIKYVWNWNWNISFLKQNIF